MGIFISYRRQNFVYGVSCCSDTLAMVNCIQIMSIYINNNVIVYFPVQLRINMHK